MIKEWNQTSHEEEDDDDEIEPEPDPQLLWPYPFLTVPVEVYQPDGTIWCTARRSIQGATRALLPAFPRDDAACTNPFGKSFGTEDKLEEFIPDAFFPDVLVVNDPTGITEGKKATSNGYEHAESSPIKYKRLWPILERTEAESSVETGDKVAFLNLASAPLLGKGHHSIVHRAALKLPGHIEAHSADGSMAVAAKIAFPVQGARDLLHHEGEIYGRIYGTTGEETTKRDVKTGSESSLRHLMEDWSGFHLLSRDIRHPVPASAVVPKFFGYYVPFDESEVCDADEAKVDEGAEEPGDEGDTDKSKDNSSEEHRESDKEGGRPGKVAEDADETEEVYWHWCKYSTAEENAPPKTRHSPILLVEDCGVPIEPKRMNIDDR
ncbi:hypothetical protein EYR38_010004 [Pleurotus pulmonarius]|nr:hypothetical protein EYR38_010004 [Pleurotus pulmonarius]